jgi:hypothetical protein
MMAVRLGDLFLTARSPLGTRGTFSEGTRGRQSGLGTAWVGSRGERVGVPARGPRERREARGREG